MHQQALTDEQLGKLFAGQQTAQTTMRGLWTEVLGPYLQHLAASGDPEKFLKAQELRLRFERAMEDLEAPMGGREPPDDERAARHLLAIGSGP